MGPVLKSKETDETRDLSIAVNHITTLLHLSGGTTVALLAGLRMATMHAIDQALFRLMLAFLSLVARFVSIFFQALIPLH